MEVLLFDRLFPMEPWDIEHNTIQYYSVHHVVGLFTYFQVCLWLQSINNLRKFIDAGVCMDSFEKPHHTLDRNFGCRNRQKILF